MTLILENMELNQLIRQLIDSGIVENQNLGVTMLSADSVTEEEKRGHLNKFIEEYTSGKVNFFDEEHKSLFDNWVSVYIKMQPEEVSNRVKRII